MADACFQIKGTNFTTLSLDLYQYNADRFAAQLEDKVKSAPQFFRDSPLFINLAGYVGTLEVDTLKAVVHQCRQHGFQPFGVRGASDALVAELPALGLTALPAPRTRSEAPTDAQPAQSAASAVGAPSKVIHRPVRSGQQIYAEGGDLILLAPVSEGAEVIADGNIHVYSTLRGRALAGVKDNPEARIFCQQLEAELVAIAGHFILNDSLREHCWKQAAQIYLDNESIQISAL